MKTNDYRYQQDLKNIEKIRELLKELPAFCKEYFLALEARKSTDTRKQYAYDLTNFFHFLKGVESMAARKDNKGRALRTGECQRKSDGRYVYSYVDPFGKRRSIYS